MSAFIPRKAIIAITSYNGVFYPDGKRTGLFYTEALHPYDVLTKAGFEVDLATETGTFGLDDHSTQKEFLTDEDQAIFDNPMHPFNVKLRSQLKKASDLRKEDYGLFFASAGHAAIYDYPHARALQAIAQDIWRRGGIVSAVCHGPAILPGIVDPKTGKSIIAGKSVTGFTIEGEVVLHVIDRIRQDNVVPIQEAAETVGAKYLSRFIPSMTSRSLTAASQPGPIPRVRGVLLTGPSKLSTAFKCVVLATPYPASQAAGRS